MVLVQIGIRGKINEKYKIQKTKTIRKHHVKSKGAKEEYINTMNSGRRERKKNGAPIKIPESFIRIN